MNGNRIVKLSAVAIMALTLMSCSSKNGNYLNILQLPGTILDSVFDNNTSNITREKVETYTKIHYEILRKEIKEKKGKHLDEMMILANIEASQHPQIKAQLHKEHQTIFHNTQRITEKLVQTMSRLYSVKEKTKSINGFSYKELSEITEAYIEKHFEEIRLAVKSKDSTIFIPLAEKLNIKDTDKKEMFIKSLLGQHYELYDDLLVVAVVIHAI